MCNEISGPAVLEYLPILLLNFNLYCIVCTVRTTRYKGLLFVKGICQTIYHSNCFWMFVRPHIFGLTTWRDVIENCIGFSKCIQIKQTFEICSFGLVLVIFPLQSELKRICTILRFHVMKLKVLPKSNVLKKLQSWYSLVTLLSTNYFRNNKLVKYLTVKSFLILLDLIPAWFISIYKIESDVDKSVNIWNRGNQHFLHMS